MSRQFPPQPEISKSASSTSLVLELDDDAADEVLDTLSAKTTRQLFVSLYEEPLTISELATAHETSIQNAQYHIEKLQAADLIEVRGTRYSERGTEMKVYAPTSESLVLFAGEEAARPTLRRALVRLFGAVGVIAGLSLFVQAVANRLQQPTQTTGDIEYQGQDIQLTANTTETAADRGPISEFLELVTHFLQEPGGLVFVVGLLGLLTLFGLWYTQRYRSVVHSRM